jgi:hypothetical protein
MLLNPPYYKVGAKLGKEVKGENGCGSKFDMGRCGTYLRAVNWGAGLLALATKPDERFEGKVAKR